MAEKVLDWDEIPDTKDQTFAYFRRGMTALWQLTETERRRIVVSSMLLVLGDAALLGTALLVKDAVDRVNHLPHVHSLAALTSVAHVLVVPILGLFALSGAMLFVKRCFQEPLFLRAIVRLENLWPSLAFRKLLALSVGYHERENTGRKIAKVSKGVEKLVMILADLFWQLLPAAFYLIINACIIFSLDWRLGLIFSLPLIPAVWLNLRCYARFQPTWIAWDEKKEEAVGCMCQAVINIRTAQDYVAERQEDILHSGIRSQMEDLDLSASLSIQSYLFTTEALMQFFFYATLVTGMCFVLLGWSTIGTIAYIAMTGSSTLSNIFSIINVYSRIMRNLVAAERMHLLLNEPVDVANEAPGVIPDIGQGVLAFEGVTLTHAGKEEPLFDSFDLTINPGEMIALVGRSGSGKSTLANLLRRVYDPTSGMVTIDGRNVRTVDRDWYRRRFAHVAQDVEIRDCSIRENIAYGTPAASTAIIEEAARAACLDAVMTDAKRFPKGLDELVGENGVHLSGGEKQRVGIARAYVALLAGEAEVLVLDEATSSLDSESERVVQGFIERLRQKRTITIVAIAHRLSTIKKADRICGLDNGRIVEMGTHAQLLQTDGLYRHLSELQELGDGVATAFRQLGTVR